MIIRRLIITLILVSISDAGFFSDLVSNLKGNSNSGSNSGGGGGISHGHSNKFNVAPVSDDKAKDYLQDFGYISPTNLQTGGMAGDFDVGSMIKKAVIKFQEFAGLAKTGILDSVTRKKMAMPRCGFTDAPLAITASGGSSGFKWKKSHITYSFESYTPDLDRDTVRRAIREAYGKWSAVAPISFEEVPQGRGDIKIKFGTKNHGDPCDYTDVLAVAIHEGGHTLGLEHSRNDKAIMAPFYQSTVDNSGRYIAPELTSDDISAIQDIYGRPWFWFILFIIKQFFEWFELGRFFRSAFIYDAIAMGWLQLKWMGKFEFWRLGRQLQLDDQVHRGEGQRQDRALRSVELTRNSEVLQDVRDLSMHIRQVYGYLFNRHNLKFDLDNGFPKQLPRDVPFRPTGALRWVNGHQVVLSESGQFVVYDENWNKVTLTSRIDNYFENLPYNVKGTELAAGMSLTGFTSNSVFTYDSRAKRVTNETPLSRYLQC
ncbi:hypothetical protein WR25_11762 [Diploscapter pachys]|uniref:Peptidase metallopeptidase domain-containing protein n=1 Tax=Diploscapter pachys TaxID=2018661 RepID=A0A2A2JXD7_9BILA|nr:hypothetical protein WR25_11762 [Diploscapter pachys]